MVKYVFLFKLELNLAMTADCILKITRRSMTNSLTLGENPVLVVVRKEELVPEAFNPWFNRLAAIPAPPVWDVLICRTW